ncbi:MAG: urease accessory protein UreD [Pseudomonadota bacterium]
MSASATETSIALPRAVGRAEVEFKRRGDETVLASLYQQGSAKVRFPAVDQGDLPQAVLLNTSGGLTDGDRYLVKGCWRSGTRAILTTQAAERIYRSRGDVAVVDFELHIGSEATAVFLPQETIVFDGGRCARNTAIHVDANAHLLVMDALVLGRHAMDEVVRTGRWLDYWQIYRDGRLSLTDRFALESADDDLTNLIANPTVLGGRAAVATGFAMTDADPGLQARVVDALASCDVFGGASLVGHVVCWRMVADDGNALRRASNQLFDAITSKAPKESPFAAMRLPRVFSC